LRQAGFEPEEIAESLARLERVGLVDDEDFARQVAEHRFGVRREGSRSVTSALLSKGVAPALVAEIVASQAEGEEERAGDLAASRVARMRGLEPATAFTRLSSFLMRRGYRPDVARSAARRALGVAPEGE
jgi:regulatory protein